MGFIDSKIPAPSFSTMTYPIGSAATKVGDKIQASTSSAYLNVLPVTSRTVQWSRSDSSSGPFVDFAADATLIHASYGIQVEYTVKDSDLGKWLRVTLSATNDRGTTTKVVTSQAIIAVAPTISGASMSGTYIMGQPLTAQNGAISGSAPITLSYVWQRSSTYAGTYATIPGATASTYVPVQADVFSYVRFTITATNAYGAVSITPAPVAIKPAQTIRTLGSVGPAGGIIVWDRGSFHSDGRYLEVAPYGWYNGGADPDFALSANSSTSFGNSAPGGFGETASLGQTNLIVAQNSTPGYAATVSRSYAGGGWNNWCLPSYYAQSQMYNYVAACSLNTSGYYVGSNETSATGQYVRSYADNGGYAGTKAETGLHVRPVHFC